MKVINGQEVYTRDDCKRLRTIFQRGEKIKFETNVYKTSTIQGRFIVNGTIMGVYTHGLQVGFWYRNWKGLIWLVRWLSYKDILDAELSGKLPYSFRGCPTFFEDWDK